MEVNEKQKTIIVPRIMDYFGGSIKGKKFALWGLAFKPDTDDIREAPALYIIDALVAAGATVVAYDPEAMENVKALKGGIMSFASDQYEALNDADALIIATEWSLFRTPELEELKKRLKAKVIFDGRNLYELDTMRENGFYYASIGRETIKP